METYDSCRGEENERQVLALEGRGRQARDAWQGFWVQGSKGPEPCLFWGVEGLGFRDV